MLRNRKDYPTFITPKAKVIWGAIDEPDYDYKDGGEFHIKVRFDPDDAAWADIMAQAAALLDEAYDAKVAELKAEKKGALLKKLHKRDPIFTMETDRETGDETGMAVLRAGMKFRVEVKNGPNAGKTYEFTPDVFDARGKQLKKRPRIGGGSTVRISAKMMEYFIAKDGEMGISFSLEAVQIIDLVQGGKRDAESYGFGAEDGYTAADDSGGFDDEGEGYEGGDESGGSSDF
jgi:hypothetical protein